MSVAELSRKAGETELEYIWRLGSKKDSGLIDYTWTELTEVLNKELREPDEEWTESAYRKKYTLIKQAYENVFSKLIPEDIHSDIVNERHELEKEKVKVRDERNELRRLLREQSRRESFVDLIERTLVEHSSPIEFVPHERSLSNDNETNLIIPFMDIHNGLKIKNWFNEYDLNVLKKRTDQYLRKIEDIQSLHNSGAAYVVLSELISGLIHNTLRIENNMDVLDQFLSVCDVVCYFLTELSGMFEKVFVYMVPGNHSRVTQSKEECLSHENFDNFAIPYLSAKMQNYDNIEFRKNKIEHSIALFSVNGQTVVATHGDKDTPENIIQSMTMLFGIKPDIALLGHKHTNAMKTVYDSKVIQTGCMSGSDTYCVDKRLKNKPEQTVIVVNSSGVDCIYDVKFD